MREATPNRPARGPCRLRQPTSEFVSTSERYSPPQVWGAVPKNRRHAAGQDHGRSGDRPACRRDWSRFVFPIHVHDCRTTMLRAMPASAAPDDDHPKLRFRQAAIFSVTRKSAALAARYAVVDSVITHPKAALRATCPLLFVSHEGSGFGGSLLRNGRRCLSTTKVMYDIGTGCQD
jgi:hypothetical protein